ncbi:uncharacterized protein LOC124437010 [Xenia sp. Carnegie-2017]|uniref:uncharacterized protein LOC124437010 n=1 Tax=Xenia sp. Carnegie-2017 TaxID=2897299 RepID=UPI001F03BA34|nr:uncharacterized protein LOC124437010 [Xenia sp. Carnegie-2017]
MGTIPKGSTYIKTVPFFLKISAFIVLLVGIGTLGRFLDKVDKGNILESYGGKARLEFGMSALVVSWVAVIVMIVVFVSGLHEKITAINWPLTVLINMILWAAVLLVACGLLAYTVYKYETEKTLFLFTFCDTLKRAKNFDANCSHLYVATACCFIAAKIFAIDAKFNYKLYKDNASPAPAPSTQGK